MTYSSEIISVFTGSLKQESASEEDNTVLLCDARELHQFLQVGKYFSNWIKKRIEDYGFIENQDFVGFCQNGQKPIGGRPTTEYHLTLDMAKELAMVERNEQGRAARRYFIECEKALKQSLHQPQITQERLAEDRLVTHENIAYWLDKLIEITPTVTAVYRPLNMLRSPDATGMMQTLSTIQSVQNLLSQLLLDNRLNR